MWTAPRLDPRDTWFDPHTHTPPPLTGVAPRRRLLQSLLAGQSSPLSPIVCSWFPISPICLPACFTVCSAAHYAWRKQLKHTSEVCTAPVVCCVAVAVTFIAWLPHFTPDPASDNGEHKSSPPPPPTGREYTQTPSISFHSHLHNDINSMFTDNSRLERCSSQALLLLTL